MGTVVRASGRGGDNDLVDRWFRALDQRSVRVGLQQWHLQITGIYVDEGQAWIQIADGLNSGGSIVLRVNASTSVDQALKALARRRLTDATVRPLVVSAVSARVVRETRGISAALLG